MNVLILSAAAKVLLVEAFTEAAHERGGSVLAADIAADSAALHVADHAVLVPRSDQAEFVPCLLRLCHERRIRLIVPTRDGELPILAAHRARFAEIGTTVLAAPPETIELCQDKRRFVAFCIEHRFPFARTYASDERPRHFPLFVRPATGAGGAGARRIDTEAEWHALGSEREKLLIQEFVRGDEYTVDTLMDLAGKPIQAVPRRRLLVRGGEAQKSCVEDAADLTRLALSLGERLGLVGHNVIQAFRCPDGALSLIEVNPRFGGASNLSIVAGLDSPRRILALLNGEKSATAARPIRFGLSMLRYSRDVIVDPRDLARVAACG